MGTHGHLPLESRRRLTGVHLLALGFLAIVNRELGDMRQGAYCLGLRSVAGRPLANVAAVIDSRFILLEILARVLVWSSEAVNGCAVVAVPPIEPGVLLVSRPKPHIFRARDFALRATCAATLVMPHEKDAGAAMGDNSAMGKNAPDLPKCFRVEAQPAHYQCDLGSLTINERKQDIGESLKRPLFYSAWVLLSIYTCMTALTRPSFDASGRAPTEAPLAVDRVSALPCSFGGTCSPRGNTEMSYMPAYGAQGIIRVLRLRMLTASVLATPSGGCMYICLLSLYRRLNSCFFLLS
ncbi:hypothetical protein B0H13DRAFT_2307053 [Mycena leptocephala]|nr:hypothetical protein B0H13DRAFT_2313394 [Mycena leptocephala]KAJ7933095.1 hypothetical protein B0H13DRAFT_2307053 [Mycena leptocephala]